MRGIYVWDGGRNGPKRIRLLPLHLTGSLGLRSPTSSGDADEDDSRLIGIQVAKCNRWLFNDPPEKCSLKEIVSRDLNGGVNNEPADFLLKTFASKYCRVSLPRGEREEGQNSRY